MIDSILTDAKTKFKSTLDHLSSELAVLRSSHVAPSLIQDIPVKAYDGMYTIKELAAISLQDVSTLVVQVWDQSIIECIVKSLVAAQLGATPSVDGTNIRISIPSLSQEQRENMVKLVKQKTEEAKVAVRNIRQEKNKSFDEMEENGKISEDESIRAKKDLQTMVDQSNSELETLRDNKVASLH